MAAASAVGGLIGLLMLGDTPPYQSCGWICAGVRRERGRREADLDDRAHARRHDRVVNLIEARPVVGGRLRRQRRRGLRIHADVAVQDAVEARVAEPGLVVPLLERVLRVPPPGRRQDRVGVIGRDRALVEAAPRRARRRRVDRQRHLGTSPRRPRRRALAHDAGRVAAAPGPRSRRRRHCRRHTHRRPPSPAKPPPRTAKRHTRSRAWRDLVSDQLDVVDEDVRRVAGAGGVGSTRVAGHACPRRLGGGRCCVEVRRRVRVTVASATPPSSPKPALKKK